MAGRLLQFSSPDKQMHLSPAQARHSATYSARGSCGIPVSEVAVGCFIYQTRLISGQCTSDSHTFFSCVHWGLCSPYLFSPSARGALALEVRALPLGQPPLRVRWRPGVGWIQALWKAWFALALFLGCCLVTTLLCHALLPWYPSLPPCHACKPSHCTLSILPFLLRYQHARENPCLGTLAPPPSRYLVFCPFCHPFFCG